MPKIKSFITLEGTLSQEEFNNQIKEIKRLGDLKAEKEKSEQELRKMFNQATLMAQAQKWVEHETKKAKMIKWLEVYALASKKSRKSNDMLLQSLRAKFEWIINQAKKLGLPPPPTLATFRMIAEDKKRKRTKFLKEDFVTENITVDGMYRNLIPPTEVMPIDGLVINEPESGIFFMNRNTDIAFRRIKVKDIIKEVKDYLKTYSLAMMDISWSKEHLPSYMFVPSLVSPYVSYNCGPSHAKNNKSTANTAVSVKISNQITHRSSNRRFDENG
ncbi:hypothetical protein Tco_1499079 [Tanacetum coccineum]